MRKDKAHAIKLRLQGKSYTEIQTALRGISKGTLSLWLKDITLSDDASARIQDRTGTLSLAGLLKKNKLQTHEALQRKKQAQESARSEIRSISRDALFLIGVVLYWGEGYKRVILKNGREVTYHAISLTNSDPILASAFTKFLLHYCGVPKEKIKASLRIFPHIKEKLAIQYWSNMIGIPVSNFTKTYTGISRSSSGKKPYNRLPFGIIQIRVNNTPLFHRIIGWIQGVKEQISKL